MHANKNKGFYFLFFFRSSRNVSSHLMDFEESEEPLDQSYGDEFYHSADIKTVQTHTQANHHQCSVCDRSFEHSGKLHRHMRIHTGDRPYHCTECNKAFVQSGQLVIHMRTHTGEKPYSCDSCFKAFTCSKQLKVHMRSHTGEKPYHCDLCGKSFAYNHVLKLHQVKHYTCRVYRCNLCTRTFADKKTMEQHVVGHEDSCFPRRPSSTGSTASAKSQSQCSPPPTNPKPIQRPFFPTSANILPSVHLLPVDEDEMKLFAARRSSVVRRNPQYEVTDVMIKRLLEDDYEKFGSLPVLRSPSLSVLSTPVIPCPTSNQEEPINLSITSPSHPSPSISPPALSMSPPAPTPSPPSFSGMSSSSLPPRKRHLVTDDCDQFAM